MNTDLDKWAAELALMVSKSLVAFRSQVDEQVEIFAVDCHPWNAIIGLDLPLTTREIMEDPQIANPSAKASWKYFDFTDASRFHHLESAFSQEHANGLR